MKNACDTRQVPNLASLFPEYYNENEAEKVNKKQLYQREQIQAIKLKRTKKT